MPSIPDEDIAWPYGCQWKRGSAIACPACQSLNYLWDAITPARIPDFAEVIDFVSRLQRPSWTASDLKSRKRDMRPLRAEQKRLRAMLRSYRKKWNALARSIGEHEPYPWRAASLVNRLHQVERGLRWLEDEEVYLLVETMYIWNEDTFGPRKTFAPAMVMAREIGWQAWSFLRRADAAAGLPMRDHLNPAAIDFIVAQLDCRLDGTDLPDRDDVKRAVDGLIAMLNKRLSQELEPALFGSE
jgi:hypothetical protein